MTIAGDTHTYSQRAREPRSSNLRLALVTGAAVTICVALATVLPMVLADRNNPITAQAVSTCRALAAAMFAGAGVLRIARGHICSDVRSTLLGLSLLTLGIVALPLAGLLRVLTASQPDSLVPSLSRGCTTVVVLTLVAHAMHSTRGPERLGAAGLAVRVALVASAVTLVSMLAAVWPATAMPTGHPIHLAVSLRRLRVLDRSRLLGSPTGRAPPVDGPACPPAHGHGCGRGHARPRGQPGGPLAARRGIGDGLGLGHRGLLRADRPRLDLQRSARNPHGGHRRSGARSQRGVGRGGQA